MKSFHGKFLILTVITLIIGAVLTLRSTEAQTKPLTYPEIFTALKTKLPNAAFANKTDLVNWLLGQVKERKVDKPLTKSREEDLRQAGADEELIAAIRSNSPSSPETSATPKPVQTADRNDGQVPAMEFVKVNKGTFIMGSKVEDIGNLKGVDKDETPPHKVKISKDFWMQKTEVTQGQWTAIMGELPSKKDCNLVEAAKNPEVKNFVGDNRPIYCVSWNDAQEFIKKLNGRDKTYKYRLPTEAEWEYAARAGTTGDYAGNLKELGWAGIGTNTGYPHNVATKKANAWGLYDMHGNVSELVNDWYDANYYAKSSSTNPIGPALPASEEDDNYKVRRGGSWKFNDTSSRSAARDSYLIYATSDDMGFRLVREK